MRIDASDGRATARRAGLNVISAARARGFGAPSAEETRAKYLELSLRAPAIPAAEDGDAPGKVLAPQLLAKVVEIDRGESPRSFPEQIETDSDSVHFLTGMSIRRSA